MRNIRKRIRRWGWPLLMPPYIAWQTVGWHQYPNQSWRGFAVGFDLAVWVTITIGLVATERAITRAEHEGFVIGCNAILTYMSEEEIKTIIARMLLATDKEKDTK